MTELPVERVLLDAVAVIERLNVPYAIMGGLAARAWGLPRPTFDADVAVAVDPEGLQRLFEALEHEGFDVPAEHKTGFLDVIAGFKKAKVNRVLARHVWETDIFVVHGDFLHSALARAREATIGASRVRVMAPEDLVLLKLIANRRKDLADVEEIIGLCKDLEVPYLRAWAERLDVAERLNEFL